MGVGIFDQADQQIAAQIIGFAGGERHVQLDVARVHKLPTPRIITLRARITNSDEIMDLLLVANALVELDDAVRLRIEIPYLPYARQDRVCAPGQAFSLKMFARMLGVMEQVDEIVTWDCHSAVGLSLSGARNVTAAQLAGACPDLVALMQAPDSVLVCPDKGAVERTEAIAQALAATGIVYAAKVRNPETGEITRTDVSAGDLTGKTAIITDDICDGGYTFTQLAKALRERGAARVVLYVTHGLFSRGLSVFDGLVDAIYTTDSFAQADDPRLTVIAYQYPF